MVVENRVDKNFLLDETLFEKLSPLQQKIVTELYIGPLTLNELSDRTSSSIYTIGKQLSLLQFRAKRNSLERKGVSSPIVAKDKKPGFKTTYFLTQ